MPEELSKDKISRLAVIPHENGFPELNKCRLGLVFVCLENDKIAATLPLLPEAWPLIPQGYRIHQYTESEFSANWKSVIESFLEGYHIRFTHPRSFFPVPYDNLNVIEHFGPHNRVTFPYRCIENLRDRPVSQWTADAGLTYVYQLFPNIIISTHPGFKVLILLEPLAVDRTRQVTYIMTDIEPENDQEMLLLDKPVAVANSGIDEDRQMILSDHKGLLTGSKTYLQFGLFESATIHFHSSLNKALDLVTQ